MNYLKKTYIFLFLLLVPFVTGAQALNPSQVTPTSRSCNSFIGFCNPLSVDTICQALKLFLSALLALAVPVAVLFLVYAGFLFVWARGSKDGLVHARRNFFYTVIGIAIFMGAWVLGQIIANTLNQLGGGSGQTIGQCQ
jgi:hypothetical protein